MNRMFTSRKSGVSASRLAVVGAGIATAAALILTPAPAKAWWGPRGYYDGVFIAPPPVYYAPRPPVVYAVPPGYYAYPAPRHWVPGHWRGGYWIPGHWV